jgi:osmotically-inducible protein OsmY
MLAWALVLVTATSAGAAAWPPGTDTRVSWNDTWMAMRAKIALCADPGVTGGRVDDIAVEITDGVATLRGQVASAPARDEAAIAIAQVRGVRAVRNELGVNADDAAVDPPRDAELVRFVRRAMLRAFPREPIRVGARNGIVTLEGAVANLAEQVRASEVARRVLGVRAVENRISPRRVAL